MGKGQAGIIDEPRLDTPEEMTAIITNLTAVIARLREAVLVLEVQRKDVDSQLGRQKSRLQQVLELRNQLIHSFPDTEELRLPLLEGGDDASPRWLGGVALGEAIEWILQSEGREMTRDELVEVLDGAGFPLGDLAGRKIHAATIQNRNIQRVMSGIYLYVPQEEQAIAST